MLIQKGEVLTSYPRYKEPDPLPSELKKTRGFSKELLQKVEKTSKNLNFPPPTLLKFYNIKTSFKSNKFISEKNLTANKICENMDLVNPLISAVNIYVHYTRPFGFTAAIKKSDKPIPQRG